MGKLMLNGRLFSGEPKTTYTERVLWNGPATPSSSGTVITLTDAISNYDEIVFKIGKYQGTYAGQNTFKVSCLTVGDQYIATVYTGSYQGAYWDYLSDTSINIKSTSSNVSETYEKIIGIKYGDTVKIGIALDDVTDVDTTGKADNDCLRYDSTSGEWVAEAVTASNINYSSGTTVKAAIDAKKTNDVSISTSPGFVFDSDDGTASEVLGTVTVTTAIKGTFTIDTWSTIASISAAPASKLRVPAVCIEDGAFGGMVEINTNGSIRIYPKNTGEYTMSFTAAYKKNS